MGQALALSIAIFPHFDFLMPVLAFGEITYRSFLCPLSETANSTGHFLAADIHVILNSARTPEKMILFGF